MQLKNKHIDLTLDDKSGAINSIRYGGREWIHPRAEARPLFGLRFRDDQGAVTEFTARDADHCEMERQLLPSGGIVILRYPRIGGRALAVTVRIEVPEDSGLVRWNLSVEHDLDGYLDHIDFPGVVVPGDLVGHGGAARLFWPTTEGCLIENTKWRDSPGGCPYRPIEHPVFGWVGMYPACATMQFMAYYGATGGLYLGAHDESCNNKGIEWHVEEDGGISLEFRLFPGAIRRGKYTMPYDMILGTFEGDWWDAADIYRRWVESSKLPRPPKLRDNPRVPAWIKDSPIVVTYPVRGKKDLGDQTPNCYFPYTNALPYLDALGRELDSNMLVLLMHWEGSAPWAPPYVWPPYGGKDNFMLFQQALHARGHQLGVYGSGTGYTVRSNTDPTYEMSAEFKEMNLKDIVCIAPDGALAENGVCCGEMGQRMGYDMCPATDWVKEVVTDQIQQIIAHGVDYIQYFDQNLGGNCPRCYSTKHGHAPGSGPWQIEEMRTLYQRLQSLSDAGKQKPLLGCESSSAEPFTEYLLYNDLRFVINYAWGQPVPAYAYIHHEYLHGFMGNQNGASLSLDMEKSPLNLHQRVAHAFICGDALTAILKADGQLHWEWSSRSWDEPGPHHASVALLLRRLNAWRCGAAKEYLVYGRMLKPYLLEGTYNVPMVRRDGDDMPQPSLFTSRWQVDGKVSQVVVNYTPGTQTCSLVCPDLKGRSVRVVTDARGVSVIRTVNADGRLGQDIPGFGVVMVESIP